jgi:hypothetical protein
MQGTPDPDASNTSRLFVHLTGDVDVSTLLKLSGYQQFDSFLIFSLTLFGIDGDCFALIEPYLAI